MVRAINSNGLPARLNELHQANLNGDPTATAEIFSLVFGPLCTHLKIAVPNAEQDQLNDACTDAIIAYLRRPQAFEPHKSSLWTFLCVIGSRRLSDLRRSARRGQRAQDGIADFELLASPSNNRTGEDHLLAHEIQGRYLSEIAQDERELKALELMCSEVRETREYAIALGLDSSDPRTAREVKRVKDKLKARLRKVRNAINCTIP